MRLIEVIKAWEWPSLFATVLLVGLSLAMLFSSTYGVTSPLSGRFARQLIASLLGAGIFYIVVKVPYRLWRQYVWLLYTLGLGSLLAVYLTARIIRGTASRFTLFAFQLQPSEFMKIALIIALAALLARSSRLGWRPVITTGLTAALPVCLILLEPDLGMAVLLLSVWAGLLIFSGLSWWATIALAVVAALIGVGAWHGVLLDYQKQRLLTFLDPGRDPLGAGYNVVQSIVALGSGGWIGRGLGHGPQSQLQFLPERHTDFILASIGEELGFVGVGLVIALYAVILRGTLLTARRTHDRFGRMICAAVFLLLLMSLVVAAGMNMGLLPVTGIPLPLVSYGGSNLLTTLVLLGLVQSVRVHSKWSQSPPPEVSYVG